MEKPKRPPVDPLGDITDEDIPRGQPRVTTLPGTIADAVSARLAEDGVTIATDGLPPQDSDATPTQQEYKGPLPGGQPTEPEPIPQGVVERHEDLAAQVTYKGRTPGLDAYLTNKEPPAGTQEYHLPTKEHRGGPPLDADEALSVTQKYSHLVKEKPHGEKTVISDFEITSLLDIANRILRDVANGQDAADEVKTLYAELKHLETRILTDGLEVYTLDNLLQETGAWLEALPYKITNELGRTLRTRGISASRKMLEQIQVLTEKLDRMPVWKQHIALITKLRLAWLKQKFTISDEDRYVEEFYGLKELYIPEEVPDNTDLSSGACQIFRWKDVVPHGPTGNKMREHKSNTDRKDEVRRSLAIAKKKSEIITLFFAALVDAEHGRFREIEIEPRDTPTEIPKYSKN